MGISAPAPRITPMALWLVFRLFVLPLLAALILFDVVVWWVADALWGICIGLWCWF